MASLKNIARVVGALGLPITSLLLWYYQADISIPYDYLAITPLSLLLSLLNEIMVPSLIILLNTASLMLLLPKSVTSHLLDPLLLLMMVFGGSALVFVALLFIVPNTVFTALINYGLLIASCATLLVALLLTWRNRKALK